MEIKQISILNEFKCIANDCPTSCCGNIWKIPIDSDAYTKYRNEKGIWGLLSLSIESALNYFQAFKKTHMRFSEREAVCSNTSVH